MYALIFIKWNWSECLFFTSFVKFCYQCNSNFIKIIWKYTCFCALEQFKIALEIYVIYMLNWIVPWNCLHFFLQELFDMYVFKQNFSFGNLFKLSISIVINFGYLHFLRIWAFFQILKHIKLSKVIFFSFLLHQFFTKVTLWNIFNMINWMFCAKGRQVRKWSICK